MTQEEIQKVLDGLNEGLLGTRKEWQWDRANQRIGTKHSQEAIDKISENNRRRVVTTATKKKHSRVKKESNLSGSNNPNYGNGKLYIELTTGFIGTRSDMTKKFSQGKPFSLTIYVKKDEPIKGYKAKHLQGLHFRIYEE